MIVLLRMERVVWLLVVWLGEDIEGGRYEVGFDLGARVMAEPVRRKVGAVGAHGVGKDSTGGAGAVVGNRRVQVVGD